MTLSLIYGPFLARTLREFVVGVVKKCREVVQRMYVEVPENLSLFDDYVPFTSSSNTTATISTTATVATGLYYNQQQQQQRKKERASQQPWSWAMDKIKNKGTLCDSDKKFVRPSIAQDITGRWFLIVQTPLYLQKIPVELCR